MANTRIPKSQLDSTLADTSSSQTIQNKTFDATDTFPTLNQSTTGNAATATKLTTARTISTTGDVSYTSGVFDGTANVTGTATLASIITAGSVGSSTQIPVLTYDAKGRITAVTTASVSSGFTNPMTTAGDTIYGGTAGAATRLGAGSATQVLHSGTTPTWGAVSLTADVTGTLGVANGGTGVTSSTGTGSTVLSTSPALTGTPTAPTAAASTNTTQIATTAFVQSNSNNASLVENEIPAGTINGSNVTFTLASAPITNSLRLYKNGIRLKASGADYTLSGTTVTFVTAPATGAVLLADYNVGSTSFTVGTNSSIWGEPVTGLINGSNTVYSTSRAYVGSSLVVFINGIKQQGGNVHYTETTPSTGVFTMSDAPLTGDNVIVDYQFNLNPSSNADTVDGIHASSIPTANQLVSLNGNARFPQGIAPFQISAGIALVPPANATTYYAFAGGANNSTNEVIARLYMATTGTITAVYINTAATGTPTTETFSAFIRYNNTTDTLISSALQATTTGQGISNTALSIAVTAGDFIGIKIVTPTWATVPASIGLNFSVRMN